jgi:ABC-type bacteriocin/lantibiotic exporter with double-glycine peptidase domain
MILDEATSALDNLPLNTLNLRSYRRNIGAVFQFSKVMPGTIYSNIAFCPHPVNLEEAVEAAVKAGIDETIRELPLGYDTEISDSNTGGFSGGQRQRLLIARAFASKPSIMILDEATSALDNLSQNTVLESVYKEKCTVIMVAHRLSTVRNCDRIIVLRDGGITEQGTYDELMEKEGVFFELMKRQTV